MRAGIRYRYRAWDGTQAVTPLAPEDVLLGLSDALLAGGVEQAMDRALHRGLQAPDGERLAGLDALRDQIRNARRDLERSLAEESRLGELLEALRQGDAAGASLDAEGQRLLDALALHPDAARLLGALDRESRATIDAALDQRRASGRLPPGGEPGEAAAFGGTLDEALAQLAGLDDLEARVRRVRRVAEVEDIDPDRVRALLGEAAGDGWARLASSLQAFADSGFVRAPDGRAGLSARALQLIGDELLAAALRRIASRQTGDRQLAFAGSHDLTGTTREYQFGDPLALDLSRTVLQAVRRGGGLPVRLRADDFAIFECEDSQRAATVLALDLSRSMGERGYLLAARKLALALATLIRTRYPRDRLLLAGFSEAARPIDPAELPRLTWDRFGFGTNIQDALRLARAQLAAHRGLQRNLILLTDGEPTAHRDAAGRVHFSHPPAPETLAETFAEGARLRRDGIQLCVCVLSNELQVVRFAEQLAQRAAGDLIVTAPDDLGAALLLQYRGMRSPG